jgi:putative RecB family exonuclease
MKWEELKDINFIPRKDEKTKRRYSIIGDILSFNLCPRQYEYFKVKKYQPANPTQEWYGSIIHQTLDKIHRYYEKNKKIPSDEEIEDFFIATENALKVHGIRAVSSHVRGAALNVLKLFNKIEGEELYKNILDTEYRLESDLGEFILYGVVDVLKTVKTDENYDKNKYNPVEIWDYKGSKNPYNINKLQQHIKQLYVYAYLYYLKEGKYPLRGVVYYLNELDNKNTEEKRPSSALYIIDFCKEDTITDMNNFIKEFEDTVIEIERCKENNSWNPPESPDKETCDICDLRWDCSKVSYPMRYP